ncbi:MAG: hypothetical protein JOY99_02565 [Sphingomonadaceae bacterium]|nr:hypothetical protein [Sphingomonadaceae bacterium]
MGFVEDLPNSVLDAMRGAIVGEYATVSAAGVPIDTPTFIFASDDLSSFDIATGLAYPAKAERARKNPKTGLLFEGGQGKPVVSVAGNAAVCDADLQANMNRYLAETILGPPISPDVIDWSVTRQAVWYLTRIIVRVAPTHIRWWESADAMDAAPQEWRAPEGFAFPKSDPAPGGAISPAPAWPQPTWRELATRVLDNRGGLGGVGAPGHLTLLDPDGYPLPIRASGIEAAEHGFRLTVPKGAPWSAGKATLSFGGLEVFVGEVKPEDGALLMTVERALPVLPMVQDPAEVIQPTADTRIKLMERLEHETSRRGQPIPVVPETPPAPTAGARFRAEAMAAAMAQAAH